MAAFNSADKTHDATSTEDVFLEPFASAFTLPETFPHQPRRPGPDSMGEVGEKRLNFGDLRWMQSFDLSDKNDALAALLDDDDAASVDSTNTREDILQLNAAHDWLQEKKFKSQSPSPTPTQRNFTNVAVSSTSNHNYHINFSQPSDFMFQKCTQCSCVPEVDRKPEGNQFSTNSFQTFHEIPSLSVTGSANSAPAPQKPKKEHPSSNTATLKKRQGLTSSKFNGVCFNKRKKKWRARLSNKGTREFLGDFDTEEAAARAFDARIKQVMLPKKYLAKLNFKEDN